MQGVMQATMGVAKKDEGAQDWPSEVVIVEDGTAKMMVGQDVVWITATEAPEPSEPESGDDLVDAPDTTASPVTEEGGCSAHQGTSPNGLVILLLLLFGGRVVLRRAWKRLA